jgi:hypothetical protein
MCSKNGASAPQLSLCKWLGYAGIFLLGLAIDAELIHPITMLKDLPKKYAGFVPENFGKGFVGPISAQDAMIVYIVKHKNAVSTYWVSAEEVKSNASDKHNLVSPEAAFLVFDMLTKNPKPDSPAMGGQYYWLAALRPKHSNGKTEDICFLAYRIPIAFCTSRCAY